MSVTGLQVQPTAPAADPAKPAEANVRIVEDSSGRQQVRLQTEGFTQPATTEKKKEEPAKDEAKKDTPSRPEWLPAKFETPQALKDSTIALLTKQGAPKALLAMVERSESGAEVSEIYADAEKRLGKATEEAAKPEAEKPKEEAPAEAPKPVVKSDEIKAKEVAAYGSAIAGLFDTAGIIGEDFGKRYEAAGGVISEADYKGFEKAGVSRPVLDAWVTGAYGNAKTKAEVLAETHIAELKQAAGGPDEFAKLAEWAGAGHWDAEELETYNAMVSSGNVKVARKAVLDLKSAYVKANGNPPKLIDGAGGPPNQGERYNSWDEAMKDMRTKEYKSGDPAFHKKVEEKLSRSSL